MEGFSLTTLETYSAVQQELENEPEPKDGPLQTKDRILRSSFFRESVRAEAFNSCMFAIGIRCL